MIEVNQEETLKRPCTVCPPALHCFGGDWGIVLSSSLCSRNNIRGSYLLYLFLKLNDIEVDGFGFVRPNLEWGLSRLLRSVLLPVFPFMLDHQIVPQISFCGGEVLLGSPVGPILSSLRLLLNYIGRR